MRNHDEQPLAPAPVPADVGIVMALAIESGYLCDNLRRVRRYSTRAHFITEGELAGKIIAVILTGPGKAAARHGTEVLIVGHRPRWIISAGFAGGLDPSLERHDLVIPHQVIDLEGNLLTVELAVPTLPGLRAHGGPTAFGRPANCQPCREGRSAPAARRRPDRHGNLDRGPDGSRALVAVPVDSGNQRRRRLRASRRGGPTAGSFRQLSHGRRLAGNLAAPLGIEGFLDAAHAGS